MAQQAQIDFVVDAFKATPMFIFFPNLETTAGVALLESLSAHLIDCDFEKVRENCPNLWACFTSYKLALMLATWPVTITVTAGTPDTSSVTVGELGNCSADGQLFLKRRKTGAKECEWAQYDAKKANCPPTALAQWQLGLDHLMEICRTASEDIFMGGGSEWPSRKPNCDCSGGTGSRLDTGNYTDNRFR